MGTNGSTVSLAPMLPFRSHLQPIGRSRSPFDAAVDQYCEISSSATDEQPSDDVGHSIQAGESLSNMAAIPEGIVFIAPSSGKYRLVLKIDVPDAEMAKDTAERHLISDYSTKFQLPKGAQTQSTRIVNGYQAKIVNEAADEGKTYFLVQKGGKTKAIMRAR